MELAKICKSLRPFGRRSAEKSKRIHGVGWLVGVASAAIAVSGCSSAGARAEGFGEVSEEDRLTVDVATNRQMQIGYQIQSVSTSDNALDLCFEMCNRSSESCHLANSVCNISKRYPAVSALSARCDVTRERCRSHRTKVPRQCPCEL